MINTASVYQGAFVLTHFIKRSHRTVIYVKPWPIHVRQFREMDLEHRLTCNYMTLNNIDIINNNDKNCFRIFQIYSVIKLEMFKNL